MSVMRWMLQSMIESAEADYKYHHKDYLKNIFMHSSSQELRLKSIEPLTVAYKYKLNILLNEQGKEKGSLAITEEGSLAKNINVSLDLPDILSKLNAYVERHSIAVRASRFNSACMTARLLSLKGEIEDIIKNLPKSLPAVLLGSDKVDGELSALSKTASQEVLNLALSSAISISSDNGVKPKHSISNVSSKPPAALLTRSLTQALHPEAFVAAPAVTSPSSNTYTASDVSSLSRLPETSLSVQAKMPTFGM